MSKVVTLLEDAYPFGCRGDVVTLTDDEIKALDVLAKSRARLAADTDSKKSGKFYVEGASAGESRDEKIADATDDQLKESDTQSREKADAVAKADAEKAALAEQAKADAKVKADAKTDTNTTK